MPRVARKAAVFADRRSRYRKFSTPPPFPPSPAPPPLVFVDYYNYFDHSPCSVYANMHRHTTLLMATPCMHIQGTWPRKRKLPPMKGALTSMGNDRCGGGGTISKVDGVKSLVNETLRDNADGDNSSSAVPRSTTDAASRTTHPAALSPPATTSPQHVQPLQPKCQSQPPHPSSSPPSTAVSESAAAAQGSATASSSAINPALQSGATVAVDRAKLHCPASLLPKCRAARCKSVARPNILLFKDMHFNDVSGATAHGHGHTLFRLRGPKTRHITRSFDTTVD